MLELDGRTVVDSGRLLVVAFLDVLESLVVLTVGLLLTVGLVARAPVVVLELPLTEVLPLLTLALPEAPAVPEFLPGPTCGARELKEPGVLLRRTLAT